MLRDGIRVVRKVEFSGLSFSASNTISLHTHTTSSLEECPAANNKLEMDIYENRIILNESGEISSSSKPDRRMIVVP